GSSVSRGPNGSGGDALAAPWAAPGSEVAAALGVDPATGLTAAAAAERLARHGANELEVRPARTPLAVFLGQFRGLLTWMLVAALDARGGGGAVGGLRAVGRGGGRARRPGDKRGGRLPHRAARHQVGRGAEAPGDLARQRAPRRRARQRPGLRDRPRRRAAG